MKRTFTKKSHSWWWDSHISPKNSKWLAENLEVMDNAVKRMLKLIEEDGDSFAKKAEMYYQRRPELVSLVEDFYRMYRSLAERYDNVTGELRKNIPSELQTQVSGSGSDFGSESLSPSPSPKRKSTHHKPGHRAAGFDVFLGSDQSRKGSDGSSLSSESDSESGDDAAKVLFPSISQNGECDMHLLKVSELENEIDILKEKLQAYEDSMTLNDNESHTLSLETKITKLEEEFSLVKEKLSASEDEVARSKAELQQKDSLLRDVELSYKVKFTKLEEELSMVKEKLSASEEEVGRLKAELEQKNSLSRDVESSHSETNLIEMKLDSERQRTRELEEKLLALEKEVTDREQTIELLKVEISDLRESFSLEKAGIESDFQRLGEEKEVELEKEKQKVLDLHKLIKDFEANISNHEKIATSLKDEICKSTDKFSKEKFQLQGEISSLLESHKSLEDKFQSLEVEVQRYKTEKSEISLALEKLKTESTQKGTLLERMQIDSDTFKLTYEAMVTEKDELFAKVQSLLAVVSSRDNQLKQMDVHLHELHIEHTQLIQERDGAKKAMLELSGRVKHLEEEVEKQRALISDHAEGKREAIRQLCFSIEHYRDGYEKLLQALHGHRRTVVMAS